MAEKEPARQPGNDFYSGVPPDPTTLTTQQLWREVAALKELIFTRLAAMDTAIIVAHDDLVRVPTDVQKQVGNLKELHGEKFVGIMKEFENRDTLIDEKFASIQTQFRERDTRTEQTTKDGKTAVDAALQAAKEAVGKSESSTVKQIDQQGSLIQSATKALDDKITDTKDRLTRLEGRGEGTKDSYAWIFAIIAAAAALAGLVIGFIR